MPTYTDPSTGIRVSSDSDLSDAELTAAFAPTPENLKGFATAEAGRQGIPDEAPVILNMLQAESSTNAATKDSPKGAMGPMQLMSGTAQDLGVDARDPWDNIRGGIRYYKQQLDAHGGDRSLALASYNAGPGRVADAGNRVPQIAETLGYVQKTLPTPDAPATPAPTPAPAPAAGSISDLLHARLAPEAARTSPEGFAKMDIAAPLFLPPGSSYTTAGGIGGAYAAIDTAIRRVRAKGLADLSSDDYRDIGKAGLAGAVVGMAMHGVANLIFGKPDAARRLADETLTVPGGPLGRPQLPPVPADAAGKAALGQRVEDLITPQIPQVESPQVSAAYNDFKATTAGRPIDVTRYNQVLKEFEDVHFPDARQPSPDRLFAPVGTPLRVTIPGQGKVPRWQATPDELLASENGLAFAARQKNPLSGETNIQAGLMTRLRSELAKALSGSSLTAEESAALANARGLARLQHQAEDAKALLDLARSPEGVINPSGLAKKLVDRPELYTNTLGPELYGQMKTLAQAGHTLSKVEGGPRIFLQIATRAAGALAGYAGVTSGAGYGTGPGIGGAIVGGTLASPRLFGPYALRILEGLARQRPTSGAVPEAVGRLAVAFAMDEPAPQPSPLGPGMPP